MTISYVLDFSEYNSHLVKATLTLDAPTDNPILWLPTWLAGSYLIREFSKNVSVVHYQGENGIKKRAEKLAKNRWQLTAKKGEMLQASYEIYCYDLSVRTAYVDSERIFGNFSSLLLQVENLPDAACQVHLDVPFDFFKEKADHRRVELATGLPFTESKTATHHRYSFDSLPSGAALGSFEALDFPFEIARQSVFAFDIQCQDKTAPHRFFISGVENSDHERLKRDVKKICQCYADNLGWLPFSDYTFMTHATKNDYGGLEHINSTALVTPREDLPSFNEPALPTDNYQRFLGLCSHEYFHAWWVKSVRPDVMMTSDLQSEAYTPLLWVFEGFTSYIDDLMLYRSGIVTQEDYLKLLSAQITRYYNTDGSHHQSVAESSFDAWIKLYRPDENSQNATVSYYNKGALVALGLDLLLIKHGKRLFDVVRHFVNIAKTAENRRFGMSEAGLDELLFEFLGKAVWQDFKDRYITGVEPLPLEAWLLDVGVVLTLKGCDSEPFGISFEQNASGLAIKRIRPNSSAAKSGLSALDTLIAINGLKADAAALKKAREQAQHAITVHAFRRDVLLTFTLNADNNNQSVARTLLTGTADERWLEKTDL
ncbi:MAG: M61 family peptidase [Moraxella sp.]|nr:M61 family peptidase [Moraxella sp.]